MDLNKEEMKKVLGYLPKGSKLVRVESGERVAGMRYGHEVIRPELYAIYEYKGELFRTVVKR